MARRRFNLPASRQEKPDETNAQKITKNGLSIFKKALVFIGKPAFFLLSHLFIALLFIFYITGYFSRIVFSFFSKYLKRLFIEIFKGVKDYSKTLAALKTKGPKIIYPKFKLPKLIIRLTLPKIKLPKFKIQFPAIRHKLLVGILLIIITFAFFINLIIKVFKDLPSPKDLAKRNIEVSTKIYDRNGILLYNIFENKNRTIIPLEQIPLNVRLATLAAEDAEFYNHPGFSLKGIFRALYKNLTQGKLTGGSTITQQLVKNALLTPEKTLIRKLKEIILSLQVEMAYSKDSILEMYLNEVSYGGTAYGIAEASRMYFGKDVNELSLAEATLLAGLPKSPTKYSPFANLAFTLERQKEVLHLMKVNGYITEEQERQAENEGLTFANQKADIKAPHFVMFLRQILEETHGKEMVAKGGLNVTTTLDYEIQQYSEEVVKSEIEKLSKLNVTNAAVLILNPQTGEILAMVGSKDYFDVKADGNVNVITSKRQPGSSIKVVNYAYALSHEYTPATIIQDSPVTFLVEGQPPYSPKNYDGKYSGNLTLREAFAQSRNIPAVRVLASYGVKKMIEMGKILGITTWDEKERFGLSLTLGGGEVKLIDLARVYATIANYGKRPEISPIITITDYQGRSLFFNSCIGYSEEEGQKNNLLKEVSASEFIKKDCIQEQVLDPRVAYLITDILKDNDARAPAFGRASQLVIPNHKEVAVKTGTSNNLRDNLTIGYNQKYLVAVWVGNNDNSPMSRVASGVTGASPIFNKIMTALLKNEPNHDWKIPQGLVKSPICINSEGQMKMEWFLEENQKKIPCLSKSPEPNLLESNKNQYIRN